MNIQTVVSDTLNKQNLTNLNNLLLDLLEQYNKLVFILVEFYGVQDKYKLSADYNNEKNIAKTIEKIHSQIIHQINKIQKTISGVQQAITIIQKDGLYNKKIENIQYVINNFINTVNTITDNMNHLNFIMKDEDLVGMLQILPPPNWKQLINSYVNLTKSLKTFISIIPNEIKTKTIDDYFKG